MELVRAHIGNRGISGEMNKLNYGRQKRRTSQKHSYRGFHLISATFIIVIVKGGRRAEC